MSFASSGIRCHICAALSVDLVPGYDVFRRVTSDCKPWLPGGQIGVCRACGCVQKVIDRTWQLEASQIYSTYSIYHQGQGAEQAVFAQDSGLSSARSVRLVEQLQAYVQLSGTGRLLDIGCGNGALLRTFSRLAPQWSLIGTELDDKYRPVVESIDRAEMYTCDPDQIPGSFSLITMIHLLEHIPTPRDLLLRLWNKLDDNGLLVVEVPGYAQNPFDLLIADHCTHFTTTTVTELVENAGYEAISVATDWIPKELTVIAHKCQTQQRRQRAALPDDGIEAVAGCLRWLESVVTASRKISRLGDFGVFGTSIAATWLYGELQHSISFFVDEDPHRVGRVHMGRPVFHPDEAPSGSHVFVALPPPLADVVSHRIARPGIQYHLPPPVSAHV